MDEKEEWKPFECEVHNVSKVRTEFYGRVTLDKIQAMHEIHQDPLLRQDLFLGAGPFGRRI